MRRTLLIGATSAIAIAIARRLSNDGDAFFLIARDPEKLATVSGDLEVRGATRVDWAELDVLDYARYSDCLERARAALGGFDLAIVCHGSLPEQARCEEDVAVMRQEFDTNAVSVMAFLTILANELERAGAGTLVAISSVAGDRGRKSNYVYGAAKAAVSAYLQGLRNRLHASGVNVLTVKPGFVDTPMTAAFEKGPLWATPDAVAVAICDAIENRRDVVYVPWFWRWIMLVIKIIPERIFKRLSL